MLVLRGCVPVTLHERVAAALGWTAEETKQNSLWYLRDLVRQSHPKLAHEITQEIRSGRYIRGEQARIRARESWKYWDAEDLAKELAPWVKK